jgi:hypothetical protein
MLDAFEAILGRMIGPRVEGSALPIFDPGPWLVSDGPPPAMEPAGAGVDEAATPAAAATAALTAAFLVALAGQKHPALPLASAVLADPPPDAPAGLAELYIRGVGLVRDEIERTSAIDGVVRARLTSTAARLAAVAEGDDGRQVAPNAPSDEATVSETLWSLFFPEGVGIRGHEGARESALRVVRTVMVSALNADPIADPGRQLLFTSNVLLTTPSSSRPADALPYPSELRSELARAASEPQRHWYDHPIQIGVEPAGNELLYGLRGLDEAIAFERQRGASTGTVSCILSVSVTHPGLHAVARRYVQAELAASDPLRHLDVYVFTEDDTERLVDEVLAPAVRRYMSGDPTGAPGETGLRLRVVFGVDGAYGRHYTFLKAVAALWHVLIDPGVRGTFKIDLDQVFPQEALVAQTGRSAFEHLATPLWGGHGVDSRGRDVELGMLAGALVNERDIGRGVFTPDVAYPSRPLAPDQYVFFSGLPQALSTRAEMMERHDSPERDGTSACLERIHVTGGTNGILVEALRRHRPFTPSFVGRAEDQAYLLSVLSGRAEGAADGSEPRLAYAHAAGLIMRHDKEAFAGEAMAAAEAGKLIGDDIRILQFSAYAQAIAESPASSAPGHAPDVAAVKAILDPFTGCFVSRLPVTVVLLRFALRVARTLEDGRTRLGLEMAEIGARRIAEALTFTLEGGLLRAVERERAAWHAFYDVLDALEAAIGAGDQAALDVRERARAIVAEARVNVDRP